MSNLDPGRAAFVQAEYRYADRKNTGVKALYDDAREITVDASIDEGRASVLADAYLAEFSTIKRTFEVDYIGPFQIDDLIGGLPRFTLSDPATDTAAKVGKGVKFVDRPATGGVTVTMRVA